jgi:membrane-bound lytic murein transglycosylase C
MLRACTQFGVDTDIVSAIIRSGLPRTFFDRYKLSGYGLMRLSLDNEGVGAVAYLYGNGRIPKSETIFNPDKNIEFGCAYLYEINKKFFGITDKRSRMYCAIAAYGSKPEVVARAITGEMDLGKAIIAINTIGNHDEVYQKLLHGLPDGQSRRFFKEVMDLFLQEPHIK